ncbi:MAG: hypothetical protein GY722_21485 [bacterium]|nr:hypothetical protein [bacterium]
MLVREITISYQKVGEIEEQINAPSSAATAVRRFVGDDPREHFLALFIDTRNNLMDIETISIGTIDQSLVHPREVFRSAIHRSASSIAVAHQHPSGNAQPSAPDIAVTQRLIAAGRVLGIEVLDHVVVADSDFVSIRQTRPELWA